MRSNSARESGIVQMERASCTSGDEGQINVGLVVEESSIFAFSAASFRRCRAILSARRSIPFFSLEFIGYPVDYALIPVVAAQVVVASGRANLKYAVAQLKNGNIERTAAKVEDQNLFTPCWFCRDRKKSRCRRLIDDTHNLETSDLACVLGCLTLSVVEVSRNSDNCLSDGSPTRFSASDLIFCRTIAEISSGM